MWPIGHTSFVIFVITLTDGTRRIGSDRWLRMADRSEALTVTLTVTTFCMTAYKTHFGNDAFAICRIPYEKRKFVFIYGTMKSDLHNLASEAILSNGGNSPAAGRAICENA